MKRFVFAAVVNALVLLVSAKEFGSIEKYKEEMRGSRGLGLLDELRGDLLYGLCSLRRNRSFTAVATVSLALGIGANTLIFRTAQRTLFCWGY